MEEIQLTPEKSFKIELTTDKNSSYSLEFKVNNYIEITANKISDIIPKSFSSKYSFEEISKNKYFLQFDTLYEIFDELKERIYNNKITIKENENNLILNVPLPSSKNKEIIFDLKIKNKDSNEKLNELTELVVQLNAEMKKLKNNETQMKNEINNLKNNESVLKQEINDLKEKLNRMRDEKKYINDLDSIMINNNKKYNERIKNWINPSKIIKAELLYRLSENGDSTKNFHELCDNKGYTLTLFHMKDGNIVGIYTPLSWDETSGWKNDMDTFIFNLNKNQKYKKLKADNSIYCNRGYGPYTDNFGCWRSTMKSVSFWGNYIQSYDKGKEFLPRSDKEKIYELNEVEVFKIIIE